MSEQVFRSPGFFEREVDLTQRSQEITGVPAGIIGTSDLGPAFVPTTLGSFVDFERKFGSLNTEKFGPYAVQAFLQYRTAITYVRVLGAGANQTVADINVTRTQGTVKNAGFKLKGTAASATPAASPDAYGRTEGCVQFIVAQHDVPTQWESIGYPIFSDNDSFDNAAGGTVNLVRGMVFLASGARMEIMDHDQFYPAAGATIDDAAKISQYDGSKNEGFFKLIISSSEAGSTFGTAEGKAGLRIYTASLNPDSENYVGKILNTNPDNFGRDQHYYFADFPVDVEIAKVKYHVASASVAIASGSSLTTAAGGDSTSTFLDLFGNFNTRYQTARTTYFISQPFGGVEQDLFYFESLDDGAVGNTRVKVSISNLRRSTNPKDPYGTFTVLVRDFSDSDTNLKVLEQYSECNLNPKSENFIGNKIGTMKVFYNFDAETESERRLNVFGGIPNKSRFVRVVISDALSQGKVPTSALPFGFRGLPVLKTSNTLTDNSTALPGYGSGGVRIYHATASNDKEFTLLDYSILPPVPFTFKQTRGAVSSSPSLTGDPGDLELADSSYFWGVKTTRLPRTGSQSSAALYSNGSDEPNKIINSYANFLGITKLDVLTSGSGADAFNNNKFSLSKVALNAESSSTATLGTSISTEITGTAKEHMREAAYIRNGIFANKQKQTITDGASSRITFGSLVSNNTDIKDANGNVTFSAVSAFNKFTDYLKFTNIFYGGFDGLNILDRDQRLMNDKASSSDTGGKADGSTRGYIQLSADSSPGAGKENNIVNSYRTAGRIITDEFASRVNIVAVPGIRDRHVTDYVSDQVRSYSKAIYLMDLPAYGDPDPNTAISSRIYDDSSERANVRKTVERFETRAVDNNYVATYFPDVIQNDSINNVAVNMPASIAALGAISYNDSVAYPWFAPAGFNRAALANVLNTEVRLNTEDRNILYEARINPIASFPNAGFVIFGQKTLQQSKSALDRVNVRRMLLEVKRLVSDVANNLLFENNTPATRAKFISQVTPLLSTIQSQQGIDRFKVVMDSSNNTEIDAENNRLNGKIVVVPTRAVEFIQLDFIITNSGVSFE